MNLKRLIFPVFAAITSVACAKVKTRPENLQPVMNDSSFYQFKMKSLEGEMIDFSRYKGKYVLLVNVASKCGYTPQYAELQELHEKYGDKLVVLGFPANNFGAQEPGSDGEIQEFCSKNYGVTFQMFSKISVKGEDQAPLYRWLSTRELNGWNNDSPGWNFCKYLVDKSGNLLKFYNSAVRPMSPEITGQLN